MGNFFIEALIAEQHSIAKKFELTDWNKIVFLYSHLISITSSPMVKLNQAIAMAYAGNIEKAIKIVTELQKHKALQQSHMPFAILAHLNAKLGHKELAKKQAAQSIALGGSVHEQRLLIQQIHRQLASGSISQKL